MKKNQIVLTQEQKENFQRFLDLGDRYRYSYFWGDNGNGSRRNYIEKRDYLSYKTTVNGADYEIYFSVSMSRKNVYVTKYVYKNGVKTTSRVIRTLMDKAVDDTVS